MLDIPIVTWTLTAVLLICASYHLLHLTMSHQFTDRVNKSLHALMNVVMAARLWNLATSTMLAQIMVLTSAALWFVIQAVARPEFKKLRAGSQGRLKCVYHSLTMAGAALMVAMMSDVTTVNHGIVPAGGMSMSKTHQAMTDPAQSTVAAKFDYSSDLAILLAVLFGAAAMFFIALMLHFRVTKTTPHKEASPSPSVRAEHAIDALGAAAMALMFATVST